VIEQNLKKAKLFDLAKLYNQDVYLYLKNCSQKYDIIFMDPPYQKDMSAEAIELIIENDLLKAKGLIISERSESEKVEEYEELKIIKNKKYGNSLIVIYQLN